MINRTDPMINGSLSIYINRIVLTLRLECFIKLRAI